MVALTSDDVCGSIARVPAEILKTPTLQEIEAVAATTLRSLLKMPV